MTQKINFSHPPCHLSYFKLNCFTNKGKVNELLLLTLFTALNLILTI